MQPSWMLSGMKTKLTAADRTRRKFTTFVKYQIRGNSNKGPDPSFSPDQGESTWWVPKGKSMIARDRPPLPSHGDWFVRFRSGPRDSALVKVASSSWIELTSESQRCRPLVAFLLPVELPKRLFLGLRDTRHLVPRLPLPRL